MFSKKKPSLKQPFVDEFGGVSEHKPPEPARIGLVALSKRWGIADLNDVKRIADGTTISQGLGLSLFSGLYSGRYWETASSPDTYLLSSIEAYEARVRQGITNSAIAKELTALKKEDAKKAKK